MIASKTHNKLIQVKQIDFETDKAEFCRLFQNVFGKEVNSAYVNWKFLNNPFGRALSFGAWDREKLVGFVAVWPFLFYQNHIEISGCAGGDTMVHSDYRGEGLFTNLTKRLLQDMCNHGWWFRYSIPGRMSYKGYIKKLQHCLVTSLPYWIKFRPLNIIRGKFWKSCNVNVSSDFSFSWKDYQVRLVNNFDDSFDKLWTETRDLYQLTVCRTSAFLRWRYCQHPLKEYSILTCKKNEQLMGFAVIRGGNLMELWGYPEPDIYIALVKAVEKLWKLTTQGLSHCWFIGEPLIEQALSQSGWIRYRLKPRPFGLYPEQPLICYPNPNFPKAKRVLNASEWRFSMGDVDFM